MKYLEDPKNRTMKSIFSYTFFFACSFSCLITAAQIKASKVLIYGTIRNYGKAIEVIDNDYSAPFQIANTDRSFTPDSFGRFSIEFKLDEPKYFRIARNSLYLVPGDKVEANIDYDNAQNSSFRGSHYRENDYLKSIPYPKAGSFLEGGQNIKPGIEETFLSIIDIAKQRRKKLSNIKGLSSSFRLLEQHRINADLLNSFYAVRSYFPLVYKLDGDSLAAFNKKFADLVDSYARKFVPLTVNAYLMKLEVYRDVAGRILSLTDTASEDALAINDWWLAKEIVHEMRTDSSSFDEQKINQIKTAAFRDEVFKTFEQLKNLNGSNAFDLELTDSKGNTMQLSTLKGKIIFIDVWATWCLPCMEENPHLDALKKKFKSHSEVAFLSLSIDRDTAGWTRFVNKKQLQGLQYITDLATLEPYHVSEIPRTIIIDKNFKIYAMRGPMPSDAETAVIIEKMLQ